jgi:adenine-specific DNA-methyltransferase
MKPYYEDESVVLYHGDAFHVLPTIAPASVGVLLTDPPYFQVKDEDWDRQWKRRDDFLAWLGSALDAATPALTPAASVWVFASPALTSTVEREVVAPRFRVLNSIRWVKDAGWHQRAEVEAARRYLTAWEGIIFAEQSASAYDAAVDDLHKAVMAPVAGYLAAERRAADVDRREIARALASEGIYRNEQTGAAMCSDWEHGDSLPTSAGYDVLRTVLGPARLLCDYESLRAQWDALTREFYVRRDGLDHLRRPFRLSRSAPVTDVWNFAPVMGYPGKHPCEKPLPMLRHMIEASSRPGSLVLDPFAGSGSTLQAAREHGRRAIGIEQDEHWCEHAARRLSQDVLDLEVPA